ncbi:MAG: hypothetical protein JWQ81_1652 [Amycolatopsis sp.]|jgi:hypothetical protein|uniref:hypothetical protein n=1 Tax=Amycolatopsis sp. TaxID=37632 RepID=UPI002626E3B3|nr:hypothetical protein [Amycolatopsis sp.]MCU1680913.1 hypothetical protein [Amycolatopsis sp.]
MPTQVLLDSPIQSGHDWLDIGVGMVRCTRCPVRVTPPVIKHGFVPPCSPDEQCPASISLGHHEITLTPGSAATSGSCLFCFTEFGPAGPGPAAGTPHLYSDDCPCEPLVLDGGGRWHRGDPNTVFEPSPGDDIDANGYALVDHR